MLYADVDEFTGEKLQRLARHGRNPISRLRAEILLSSTVGYSVAQLENQYQLDKTYIVNLINDFNRRHMDAVTDGTRKKRTKMVPEEMAIVNQIISMPPSIFGKGNAPWTVETLTSVLDERGFVQVIEPDVIKQLLRKREQLL